MISECFEGELSEEGRLWGIKWSQILILDSKINIIYAFFFLENMQEKNH